MTMPVLLIYGGDRLTPPKFGKNNHDIPDARMEVIEGAGHLQP